MTKTNLKTLSLLACLFWAYSRADADVMKTAMGEEKGSFSEYKDSKFILKSDQGGTVEVPKASARALILDNPIPVSLMRKGKSKRENAELLGYDKLQFKLKQKNKNISLSAMYVTSMRSQGGSSMGGQGGSVVGGGDTAIPAINTSEFDESAMTDTQKAALSNYRAVRRRYDSFLSTSSAMVAEMDRSSGQQREELLSKLRLRKNQEQPVRIEMSGAHKSLLTAFPNGFPLKPKEAPADADIGPAMPPPGESATDVIENTIDDENGEVLLIDTAPLATAGNLTDDQMKALDKYEKAAIAYQDISAKQAGVASKINSLAGSERAELMPVFEQGEKDATQAKKDLLKAQKAFLKAFPALQLTD